MVQATLWMNVEDSDVKLGHDFKGQLIVDLQKEELGDALFIGIKNSEVQITLPGGYMNVPDDDFLDAILAVMDDTPILKEKLKWREAMK